MVPEQSRQEEINTWFYCSVNNLSADDVVCFSKVLAIASSLSPLLNLLYLHCALFSVEISVI